MHLLCEAFAEWALEHSHKLVSTWFCACFCRSDEITSRLETAKAELQRAKDSAAEKEGALLTLQSKVEDLGKKVNPSSKELADAQAEVRAKRKEVEEAKQRVAEASRRFADLQKQSEMEHRRADASLHEAEQKEKGEVQPFSAPLVTFGWQYGGWPFSQKQARQLSAFLLPSCGVSLCLQLSDVCMTSKSSGSRSWFDHAAVAETLLRVS